MTSDGRPHAAIYVRVSGELQEREGTSLDTQEERCRAFAEVKGWTVAEAYREVFSGARLYERPEFARFREALRQGAFDVFVCYDADRFSRNQTHVALLEEELERAGVQLWFAKTGEKFENSAIGKFILNAKVFAAEIEREQIIERTQRGKRARVTQGRPLVGRCPLYGYEWNADKTAYVIDPVAAPIVRRIFAQAVAGKSLRSIALDLNREGIPSPRKYRDQGKCSGLWNPATLVDTLHHPAYCGRHAAYRTVYTNVKGMLRRRERPEAEQIPLPSEIAPAIVPGADWEAIQARLADNRLHASRNNRHPEMFLLRTGIVRCISCGRPMHCAQVNHRQGPVYRCNRNSLYRDCPDPVCMDAPKLDAEVWADVKRRLLQKDAVDLLLATEEKRLIQAGTADEDLATIDKAAVTISRQQQNLAAAIANLPDQEAAAPLLAQLRRLADQKRSLDQERRVIEAKAEELIEARARIGELRDWIATIAANLDTLDYEERRRALTALNVRVYVKPASVQPRWEVEATLPLVFSSNCNTAATDRRC
jgi:site-specific DNA recombinase